MTKTHLNRLCFEGVWVDAAALIAALHNRARLRDDKYPLEGGVLAIMKRNMARSEAQLFLEDREQMGLRSVALLNLRELHLRWDDDRVISPMSPTSYDLANGEGLFAEALEVARRWPEVTP